MALQILGIICKWDFLSPMLIQENVPGRGQLDHLNNELIPSALRFVWLAGGILV